MDSNWLTYKYFRNIRYGVCSVGDIIDLSKDFPNISIENIQIFFTIYSIQVKDVTKSVYLKIEKYKNKSFAIIPYNKEINYTNLTCKYICIEGDNIIE